MKLYNSLTKQKEEFKPIKKGEVGLYTCGPTVYNFAHIGNLRTYIFEDILKRTLILAGYKVNHIMNVTDVGHLVSDADTGEDKMELGAKREGKSAWDIAKQYEKKFFEDFKALNCLMPNKTPKATDHIEDMISLIKILEKKGFVYKTSDGLYFDTSKYKNYHALMGKKNFEGLKEGARVEVNKEKKQSMDFALWKFSANGEKRQMEWESPWGVGFPGWHLECSAMAEKYLGKTIDIHCGGIDHVSVHHTNEMAQSECANNTPLANFWIHGEFLVIPSGKMSKSSGTFLTLDELIKKGYTPFDYRYLCLTAHYRTQLEFTFDSLDFARTSLKSLKQKIAGLDEGGESKGDISKYKKAFEDACFNDLNTSKALSLVWDILKDKEISSYNKLEFIKFADTVFGLNLLTKDVKKEEEISSEIKELLEKRAQARKDKDFKTSDILRDELKQKGILVKDTSSGQTWEKI
ncbi:MAG: cysteine--tRNA ligase [Elusimicrobiaceae bacterium]|jgi:cysteinyl-tRNA synthetase|nr:cysteine--tRNA ligase [Elusimicrobiaceae bacterium]MBT3955349.1 cysteine--tRNA ligase [Elusimicrobiaceae bacterium]MBT4008485.1 cysteine--tRNA ligase [Elusimicrobiaceae bacterium]MBT4403373.1 cysteine--tRNA ligase [Elusimicrobiaceae bacterium]MBT4440214.1 cysteine--tRNA ligase [Elusimicrobiaceae bacterium]